MARVPLPEDETLNNLYIDDVEGIAIQETEPVNPEITLWIQIEP